VRTVKFGPWVRGAAFGGDGRELVSRKAVPRGPVEGHGAQTARAHFSGGGPPAPDP